MIVACVFLVVKLQEVIDYALSYTKTILTENDKPLFFTGFLREDFALEK